VRLLLRLLDIDTLDSAVRVITRYYPEQQFPPKAFYALEEILGGA
jgi:hypothetical protein